ncbi:MAG TPA: sensor domain-containing diguanylate cyclase [Spirochaetota bacterium]|nr:sensor domain-containing diguanylate cyclase [Spirochaetota bacterium]HPI90972.1 sensor domain-containing diguanylate cyclase [Spirochaetota bacterium]HPR47513.1 sensor domain-containing diguanylate cyclase [Spirochaetota bacterium]
MNKLDTTDQIMHLEKENQLLEEKNRNLEKRLSDYEILLKEYDNLVEKNKQLSNLIEINTIITNSLEKKEVLNRILFQVKRLLNCQTCSILLVDREINMLGFAYLGKEEDSEALKDTKLRMGEGIAGTVWENGVPIIINDTANDPRFSKRADQKAKSSTNSIIAVPLIVNGEIIGVVESINKIDGVFTPFDLQVMQFISSQSAIAIKNADLYDMAIRDGLTKLFIRKYFRERLFEEWQRSRRNSSSLTLAMLDIDHFKNVNDTYGHQAGDLVLKELSDILRTKCRSIDIPCRYGGEEFTIILPETSQEQARIFLERIRKTIESHSIDYHDKVIQVTMSVGFATVPELVPGDIDSFIEMADRALYHSKETGRNRITYHGEMN